MTSELHRYQVGQPYIPGRRNWPEVAEYNFRAGAHELRLFLRGLTAREILDIDRGPAEFGLAVEGDILFLLWRFGHMPWSDAPYTIHMVPAAQRTAPMPLETEQSRDTLHVVLVEATNGLIMALRWVSFSPAFSRALRAAIAAQLARPWPGQAEHDRQLAAIYRRHNSEQLLGRAVARCRGGED